MQKFKKYIKKRFPNFYEILFIFYNFILLRRKNYVKFDGLGLRTSISVPWDRILKNKTSVGFINVKKKLDTKIRSKEFTLSIIENYYSNSSLDDTFDHYFEEKVGVAIGITNDLVSKYDAVSLVKTASEILDGKGGGGRKDFAQAGGVDKNKIEEALKELRKKIN